MKNLSFFNYINNFWEKDIPYNSHNTQNTHFVANKTASLHADSFYTASELNRFPNIPEYAKAAVLFYGLPNRSAFRKRGYSKIKIKDSIIMKKRLAKVMSIHTCGEKHARQILMIMENNGVSLGTL